jgi:hypothetical protein
MKRFLVCLIFVSSMPVCAMENRITTNLGQIAHHKYDNGTVIYNLYPKLADDKGPYICTALSYGSSSLGKRFTCERLDALEMEDIEQYSSSRSELIFKIVEFEYLLATLPITQQNGIYKLVNGAKTFYFTKKEEEIACGSFDPEASIGNNPSDFLDAFVYRTNLSVLTAGTLAYDHVFSSLQTAYNKNPALTF